MQRLVQYAINVLFALFCLGATGILVMVFTCWPAR
jgi:hypothetical protein